MLQKLCHGLQDFKRKLLISNGVCRDIGPTSALYVKLAFDLAARLLLPGSKPAINSRSFRTCSEASVRVRLSLRAISPASALKAQGDALAAELCKLGATADFVSADVRRDGEVTRHN